MAGQQREWRFSSSEDGFQRTVEVGMEMLVPNLPPKLIMKLGSGLHKATNLKAATKI
jgi:hypothetical protein